MSNNSCATLTEMANAVRFLAADAVQKANSGHPGMPMGMADVATVLFRNFVKVHPPSPQWADRDRFVLSAGHGSMLLYALNHLLGYQSIDLEQLKNFRQLHSLTPGHPEYPHTPGVECTTGPLGQGIATAVGMALAERLMAQRYGDELVNHYTYTIAGDGCLMEGISHEAIDIAGHLELSKLIVLWDDNQITIDGSTSLSTSSDQIARFKAANWNVLQVDGHDHSQIENALSRAQQSSLPTMIACRTTIGYGAPTKAGTAASHGSPLGHEEIEAARKALGWHHESFCIPQNIAQSWKSVGESSAGEFAAWHTRLENSPHSEEFRRVIAGETPAVAESKLKELADELYAKKSAEASRKSSGRAIEVAVENIPELIGGSADLTGSNNTHAPSMKAITAQQFGGRYIHFGVREHAMGAIVNGINLHKGLRAYGGTFLVFSDYMRTSIRLAALSHIPSVFVLTHDSIGLGEDGPTHQPVEHLATLRAIPNLDVFRPADAVETVQAWQCIIASKNRPSAIALSRQSLPVLERMSNEDNPVQRGGYVLMQTTQQRCATIIATGSEVHLAVQAAKILNQLGHSVAVVSMPCWELFEEQSQEYRHAVLGSAPRIGVEAAVEFGWSRYLGDNGQFIGMNGFGASAPAEKLYEHFGITVDAIVEVTKNVIEKSATAP